MKLNDFCWGLYTHPKASLFLIGPFWFWPVQPTNSLKDIQKKGKGTRNSYWGYIHFARAYILIRASLLLIAQNQLISLKKCKKLSMAKYEEKLNTGWFICNHILIYCFVAYDKLSKSIVENQGHHLPMQDWEVKYHMDCSLLYTHCTVLYSGKYDYFMANSLQMKWVQRLNNSSQMVLPTVHKFVFSVLYSHLIWWFSNMHMNSL